MKRGWNEIEPMTTSSKKGKRILSTRCQWTPDEDSALLFLASQQREKDWQRIANEISTIYPENQKKTSKQCRERWHLRLNPDIAKTTWSEEEESRLFALHQEVGNKWSEIAHSLPGRTDNCVKNFFFCKLRKMIRDIRAGPKQEELFVCLSEAQRDLYLIHHILTTYIYSPMVGKFTKKAPGDKYTIDIIQSAGITADHVEKYRKNYLNCLPSPIKEKLLSSHGGYGVHLGSTEGSVGKDLKPLPKLSETTSTFNEASSDIKKKKVEEDLGVQGKLMELSWRMMLTDLKHYGVAHSNKASCALPVPPLSKTVRKHSEEAMPVFNFLSYHPFCFGTISGAYLFQGAGYPLFSGKYTMTNSLALSRKNTCGSDGQ